MVRKEAQLKRVKSLEDETSELKKMQDSLNPAVNEVYLFHGTSIEGAKGISTTGFRVELAGSSTAAGDGISTGSSQRRAHCSGGVQVPASTERIRSSMVS